MSLRHRRRLTPLLPSPSLFSDVGLNAIVQTEILRRSNLHLRDSLASLESSNQSLTVSLKASTDDATKLAEEMAEVSGRRGEEWRERKEEIERKREMEEEVGDLFVYSMSTQ